MAKSAGQLREEKAQLADQLDQVLNKADEEKRSLSEDEQTRFDSLEAEIRQLDEVISRVEKRDAIKQSLISAPEKKIGREDTWSDIKITTPEEKRSAAFEKYIINGFSGMTNEEVRAITTNGSASSGGAVCPDTYTNKIFEKLQDFVPMQAAPVSYEDTDSGNDIDVPIYDDTANSGAATAEGVALSDQDFATSSVTLKAFNFDSGIQKVSLQWLQDSIGGTDELINKFLTKRIAKKVNYAYTKGNGTTEPQGIVTAASLGVTVDDVDSLGTGNTRADVAASVHANLNSLIFSVPSEFRQNKDECGFMFSTDILSYLKSLTDGDGRSLWTPSLREGEPDRILGYRYFENSDMDGFGDDNKPVIFGNFSAFKIRRVRRVQVFRLDQLYLASRMIGFMGHYRTDSKLLDTNAVKYLKLNYGS